MNNCGTCGNWSLSTSPLRQHGYGLCKADPDKATRAGRTFSPQNVCRMGKFVKAETVVIVRREKELAVVL